MHRKDKGMCKVMNAIDINLPNFCFVSLKSCSQETRFSKSLKLTVMFSIPSLQNKVIYHNIW